MEDLSKCEVAVMLAVWDSPGEYTTAKEIFDLFGQDKMSLTSIRGALGRLCKKQYVVCDHVKPTYYYKALISRDDFCDMRIGQICNWFFHGSRMQLASYLYQQLKADGMIITSR